MIDISYLLWLQDIRIKCGPAVEKAVTYLTDIPFNPISIVIVCTIYWAFSKKVGTFVFFSQTLGNIVNNIVKLTVCANRPWIRCSDINPPEKAKAGATGYSFPSGHTQTMVGLYGTMGVAAWKKHRWV